MIVNLSQLLRFHTFPVPLSPPTPVSSAVKGAVLQHELIMRGGGHSHDAAGLLEARLPSVDKEPAIAAANQPMPVCRGH
jgi:hypothetical protein